MKYFFHGTTKEVAREIRQRGMAIKKGRATFTQNPEMTLPYAGEDGIILVFRDDGNFKVAVDSDIQIDRQDKSITGWINRYKNEQFGYYANSGKVPSDLLVREIEVSPELFKLLKQIKQDIKIACIDALILEKYQTELSSLASINSQVAEAAITGMLRNIALLLIRTLELSTYAQNGWRIVNKGDHEVKLFEVDEMPQVKSALSNLINQKLLDQDMIDEFIKIQRQNA